MADRDAISEAAAQNNSFIKQAATTVTKPLRAALGMAANQQAQAAMLGSFVSNTDLAPPQLANNVIRDDQGRGMRDANGRLAMNNSQMAIDKMQFQPPGGTPQTVEGWVLPPQPGQPTVVFFGGSNFDRADPGYEKAIQQMAEDAKERGMGFAAFDYPEGVNEEMAHQFVDQVQNHLAQDLGISLDQQAYSGYSQGSHLATFAAANNPDAAGLHITSGFSSARMAQKEGIDKAMGPLASLVEKRQLTETWDNIPLAVDITQRVAGQPVDAKMPISATYDTQEDFGNDNNRHMTPLIDTFRAEGGSVSVQTSSGVDHLDMLDSGAHQTGMRQFMNDTQAYAQNENRQVIGTGTGLVAGDDNAQQAVATPKTSVRDMLRGAADRVSNAASNLKATITDKVDQVKLERLEKQLEKRQNHQAKLDSQLQAMGDLDPRQTRDARLAELQKQYDPTKLGSKQQIDIANEIDEIKAANKLEDRIAKNAAKVDKLGDKVKAQDDKIKLRADRRNAAQNQQQSANVSVG
ncbi:hypothetical protein SAMN02745166_04192 [Prosthecobacter debontii]|uniref:Alpha/beta hydrolase family protein n=1 Tax=Prosthecobacter debontii TaxID=48467 RepID=A0A1T4YU92_9BACT|nr:hypothetical protein [Prosthecobacter debontii]SKB05168.1 hypothetical protein SAMN02745166_04192 [Prosthecobacter debontii]